MKGLRLWKLVILVAVAMLLVAPFLAACGPKEKPAETPKTIKLGWIVDLTGPVAAMGQQWHRGFMGFWNYVNVEKGGINGHKVEVLWRDFKYDLPTGMAQYAELKEKGIIWTLGSGSAIMTAMRPEVDKDQIVMLAPRGPLPLIAPPVGYGFMLDNSDGDNAATLLDWYLKNRHKEARPLNLALLYLDNPRGRSPAESGGAAWWKANPNIKIVADIPVPVNVPDLTVQLTKIKEAKPDAILVTFMYAEFGVLAKDMTRLGITTPILYDSSDGHGMLEPGPFPAPFYYPSFTSAKWDDTPGMRNFTQQYMGLYGEKPPFHAQWFWMTGGVLEKGIKLALDKVGYEKLNGKALKEALETITDYDIYGLTSGVTFTPTDHRGAKKPYIRYAAPGKTTSDILGTWPVIDTLPLVTKK